jgi:proteasome lid subunit RPN8/RPN11
VSALRVTKAVYEAIRAHGEETYPHECCGALLGRPVDDGWQIEASVKANNVRTDSAHNRYQIAPAELVKIEREARSKGWSIGGFYHSHPDHPAQWSQTDFAEAHWLGCSYVITAVARGKATVTNSFFLAGTTEEDKQFKQELIVVFEAFEPLAARAESKTGKKGTQPNDNLHADAAESIRGRQGNF